MSNEALYTAALKGSLKLSKEGHWFHEGTRFTKEKLSNLFHRSIIWDAEQQQYFLQIGPGRASFEIEDTAYFVCGLIDTESPWRVALLGGEIELLKPETLHRGEEHQIYCMVKGTHRARFTRGAHQQLMQYVVDEKSVMVDGQRVAVRRS